MPATSAKQKKFMDAAAHNPEFAKAAGVPVSVAKEYSKESKGMKFGKGSKPLKQGVAKPKTNHGKMNLFKDGGIVKKLFGGKETPAEEMKEARAVKSGKISPAQFVKGEKSEGHKEEKSAKLAKDIKSGKLSPSKYAKMEADEYKGMKKGGCVKKMASGGFVRSADGIAKKGKTKGKMV